MIRMIQTSSESSEPQVFIKFGGRRNLNEGRGKVNDKTCRLQNIVASQSMLASRLVLKSES